MDQNPDNLPASQPVESAIQVDAIIDIDRKATSKRVLPPELYSQRTRRIQTKDITVEMMELFLDELSKTGMWELSARRVGLNHRTIRKIRQMDSDFEAMCTDAIAMYVDGIEQEAVRRARDGWEEPVYSHKTGARLGTIRKYDSRLMERVLERHIPEYRSNRENTAATVGGVIVVPIAFPSKEAWLEQGSKPVESKVIDAPSAEALPAPVNTDAKPASN